MTALPLSIGIIHFTGIGGIGMSGIAEILHELGYQVQGSDLSVNANVKRLRDAGIKVTTPQQAKNLDNVSIVVISTAIKDDNVELIEAHSHTGFHAVRFGGGLPSRPDPEEPPAVPATSESRYIRQLLDAYGDHLGSPLQDINALAAHSTLEQNFWRQRERFYHAEALRNFARDTVPEGTFDNLQDEIFHGVVDVADSTHPNGYERMKATVAQASSVALTANPLASATKSQDRQGICHQLANEDRLKWMMDDD